MLLESELLRAQPNVASVEHQIRAMLSADADELSDDDSAVARAVLVYQVHGRDGLRLLLRGSPRARASMTRMAARAANFS